MQTLKGFIKKKYDDSKAYFNKVPKSNQFKNSGKLSPQEFMEACDQLIQVNSFWQWGKTFENKKINNYLPERKQFIIAEVPCYQRLKSEEQNDDDGVYIFQNFEVEELQKQHQIWQQKNIEEKKNKNIQKLDSDSENSDVESEQIDENLRTYKLCINYDLAEQVPRFWISGVDSKNQPLTDQQIYEDIVQEYVQKTVTKEYNPYVGIEMVYIHPCRHAEAMLYLYNRAKENGNELSHKQYMILFFKFLSTVMPTVPFDFTEDVKI